MGLTERRAVSASVIATLLIASTAACGDDGDGDGARAGAAAPATSEPNVPPTSEAPASTEVPTSSPPRESIDGVLTIGTLLPVSGPGDQIGLAGINAVNVGVRQINEAGGVLGQPVQWISASEGTTANESRAGINELLAANVDGVIGPASSLVALEVLDELMAAGVVVCSPTATALALNDYPDRELFFRTVPSDSLMAQAMAALALNTGVESYAVVYLDDEFGRPFAQQAIGRLAGPEVTELSERPFSSDATPEELAEIASELAELAPRTIVLIADSAHGWPMLQAIADVFAASDPPFIFINDAMRTPPTTDMVADLPTEFRELILGVSPVVPPEGTELAGAYATNALDCLNLIALATVVAGTDDPTAIAADMIDASFVGTLCSSFALCLNIAEDSRNFNYQGPNSIDLSSRGDPRHGRVGTFRFDATGLDVPDFPATISEQVE
jgi:branched-chain amino acid transport system substrate-binding protein